MRCNARAVLLMADRMRGRGWALTAAPSLEEFAAMADEAFSSLPESFRSLCGDLVIRVEDFPDEETVEELGCESEFDLLGLFRGIGLAHASVTHPLPQPNMVFLYRRPILDYWAEHDETLMGIVTHVLVHEIGHHFGLSDEDMMRIEAEAETESSKAGPRSVQ